MYKSLGVDGFERRFGNLYRVLFCGYEPRKASFRNARWSFVLTYHSFRWNKPEFETICRAAHGVGDDEVVVTSLQFQPRHRWSCVVTCNYKSHVEAMKDRELVHLMGSTKAMFGPSGKWGAIIDEGMSPVGGYAIFGGEQAFMDEFILSRGGIERLRNDFLKLLDDPSLKAAVPAEFRASLLSDVGW